MWTSCLLLSSLPPSSQALAFNSFPGLCDDLQQPGAGNAGQGNPVPAVRKDLVRKGVARFGLSGWNLKLLPGQLKKLSNLACVCYSVSLGPRKSWPRVGNLRTVYKVALLSKRNYYFFEWGGYLVTELITELQSRITAYLRIKLGLGDLMYDSWSSNT